MIAFIRHQKGGNLCCCLISYLSVTSDYFHNEMRGWRSVSSGNLRDNLQPLDEPRMSCGSCVRIAGDNGGQCVAGGLAKTAVRTHLKNISNDTTHCVHNEAVNREK